MKVIMFIIAIFVMAGWCYIGTSYQHMVDEQATRKTAIENGCGGYEWTTGKFIWVNSSVPQYMNDAARVPAPATPKAAKR